MVAALNPWQTTIELAGKIRKVSFGSHDRRLVEIYAVPAAMISCIRGENIDQAVARVERSLDQREEGTVIEHDEDK